MRVMVVGATGLIGAAVVSRLSAAGHGVIGISRNLPRATVADNVDWHRVDITNRLTPERWLSHLDGGVDAAVNCVGILQDAPGESTRMVHADAVAALGMACERKGIRRFVHLSAIGVDRDTPTAFSQTKLAGDEALMRLDLDWVILRPSVVVGRQAYGGSALFRGLAGLPILPVMPNTGPLQIVQLDDVVATILFFVAADAPARLSLDLAGPEKYSFVQAVELYRRWLGWGRQRIVRLPHVVAQALFKLGDMIAWLGWRPPMRSTAAKEILRGAVGDPAEWSRVTGIRPRSLRQALADEPAGVQERWFALLYFLKPTALGVLAVFWFITGINSIGAGYVSGVALMLEGGAGPLSGPSVIAGGLADLIIGLGIAWRRTSRIALLAALGLSVFYLVAGTVLLPRLWAEPLGSMLKIFPIFALMLVTLVLLKDR